MASTTTTTCDRCGSVIMSTAGLDPAPPTRGFIQASQSVRWEDQKRYGWDLCAGCFELGVDRLMDVLGEPHDRFELPEDEGEPDTEAPRFASVTKAIG